MDGGGDELFEVDELEAVDLDLLRELEAEAAGIGAVGESTSADRDKDKGPDPPSQSSKAGEREGTEGSGTGGGNPLGEDVYESYTAYLKARVEERIEEEMKERAKQSKVLAQALKDGKTGREKIEVMGALIDYLNELQLNLEQLPEEFSCSFDVSGKDSGTR